MIITITNANFANCSIGQSTTWPITYSIGTGATKTGATSVTKDGSFSATITLKSGYEWSGSTTVTMGGSPVSNAVSVSGDTITITISKVTGAVRISQATSKVNTGGDTGGDTGGGSGDGGTVRTTTNTNANPKTLPGNYTITSNTNLIGLIPQVDGKYYLGTGWGTANNISSITFPVVPGDRIAGVTFGTKAENGSTVDGTRTTFLMNDTTVVSKSPAEIYNEYKANGYITVPAGVNCVSVPFTTDADSSKKEIRLLTI